MLEQLYRPPDGFLDIPFVYAFDARGLVDGNNYQNLSLALEDNDFFLRSIVGVAQCVAPTGTWLYFNESRSEAQSSPIRRTTRYTIAPEKWFPGLGQIRFDLNDVLRSTNVDGNLQSFIGFQGIRRSPVETTTFYKRETPYPYYEKWYSYQLQVDVDFFADQGAAPKRFEIDVDNNDFELQTISVSHLVGTEFVPLTNSDPFLIQLYDASGYYRLSSLPIPVRWLNYFQGGGFYSAFPCPTLVYPLEGLIRFDLTSLLDSGGGSQTFRFDFNGIRRIDCTQENS
jgi:hypothetical protein